MTSRSANELLNGPEDLRRAEKRQLIGIAVELASTRDAVQDFVTKFSFDGRNEEWDRGAKWICEQVKALLDA